MNGSTTHKKPNEPKVGDLSLPKGEASPLRYHSPRPEGTSLIYCFVKTNPIPAFLT
jgi:hypothetical protein